MNKDGFNNLYWGFLFILFNFRIQGFDILPDIIGYILFAIGLGKLISNSEYFVKAKNFNIPMIILSIFTIYERPVQGGGVHVGHSGPLGILLAVVSVVLGLMVIYNLFMGIKDMAIQQGRADLQAEADKRWNQYLMLQIAAILAFVIIFIPILGFVYFIALFIVSIILTIVIMGFIKRCGEGL